MKFVWFDSLGAKSSCTLIETRDVTVVIDPGVAIMHPTFPAPTEAKMRWYEEGFKAVKEAAKRADVIVITHYHYDHFTDFDEEMYRGKLILVKEPNSYINGSQRERSLSFFKELYRMLGIRLEDSLEAPSPCEYRDPLREIPAALSKDFGEYNERREELLRKGMKWFRRRVEEWNKYDKIPELERGETKIVFADGRSFRFGGTKIRFTSPLFHGIEFSRLGWVLGVVVEEGGRKVLYSSDLNGPIIEDYAYWIIKENPDVLILDGPPTYILGYTLNLINFHRALRNAIEIMRGTSAKLLVYDHHLPREPRFRERTEEVWEEANKLGRRLVTVADYMNLTPAVLRYRP